MTDTVPTTTTLPTSQPNLVSGSTPLMVDPSTGLPLGVNVAQSPGTTTPLYQAPAAPTSQAPALQQSQSNASSQQVLVNADQYEKRIRDLMSEKDKAVNAWNQAIADKVALQQQLTALQEQSTSTLSATADAAQRAIAENTQKDVRLSQLERELRRANSLLQHPELTAYSSYIPTADTDEQQQQYVEQFQAVRNQDLQQLQRGGQPIVANPAGGGTLPGSSGVPPSPFQQLYGNRANVAPVPPGMMTIPGSTPAQMNPIGAGTSVDAINRMLTEARNSGDANKFNEALEQAKTLATRSVQEQIGR